MNITATPAVRPTVPSPAPQPTPAEPVPDPPAAAPPPPGSASESWLRSPKKWLANNLLPANYQHSCSPDYLPTRRWWMLHDGAIGIGNYAVGAAVAAALGVNPIWGGIAMNTFNTIKGKFTETAGFGTNYAAPLADKNPRPFIVASTLGDMTGMAAESCAALMPAGALLAFATSSEVFRTFNQGMVGSGLADIDIMQAREDNLGDLRRKNGIQSYFVNWISTGLSVGGMYEANKLVGPWAPPLVAGLAALVASFATWRFVEDLGFNPVNEQLVRDLVDRLDQDGSVPPAGGVHIEDVGHLHRITTGREVKELQKDPAHFQALVDLYKGRHYLLDLPDGKPYIALDEQSTAQDRFVAVMQAVRVEKLQASPEYQSHLSSGGPEKANMWLLQESLARTPADPAPVLDQLKKAGWTTEKLRFFDAGQRGSWSTPESGTAPTPAAPVFFDDDGSG